MNCYKCKCNFSPKDEWEKDAITGHVYCMDCWLDGNSIPNK
jgi:hypothetical protein